MRESTRKSHRKPAKVSEEQVIHQSGGNVFADLGRPHADELLAKAELARAIRHLIEKRGLTQAAAANLLGLAQPDVSNLHHGRLAGFSMERLYRVLTALGQDVRIEVRPKPRSRPHATLRMSVRAIVP